MLEIILWDELEQYIISKSEITSKTKPSAQSSQMDVWSVFAEYLLLISIYVFSENILPHFIEYLYLIRLN